MNLYLCFQVIVMKRFLLLFLFIGLIFNAQTKRFMYELEFKRDSTETRYDKVHFVLDVNSKEVKFYEYNYLISDSINKVKGNYEHRFGGDFISVKRPKDSFSNQNYELIGSDMHTFPTEDKMTWKLTNETQKLGEYTLQKATTKFGGREWTAWFNKDITIPEGPYKFRGLPGLIFFLEDSKSNFLFSLVKTKNLKTTYDTFGFMETFYGSKPLDVSENIRLKKKMDIYNDPLHEMRNGFKENTDEEMYVMNVKISKKEQFNELNKKVQQMMKKFNNPIELNKAIKY